MGTGTCECVEGPGFMLRPWAVSGSCLRVAFLSPIFQPKYYHTGHANGSRTCARQPDLQQVAEKVPGALEMALTNTRKLLILRLNEGDVGPFWGIEIPFFSNLLGSCL